MSSSNDVIADKIITYTITVGTLSIENKQVADVLAEGYRVVDIISTPYQGGVVITVLLSHKNCSTSAGPYINTNKRVNS